ncbi:MAG: hypothetical protein JXA58_04720 [Dehalococcoidia bacterium]|nr:hypothetical protein [Dehalococcoidia bacterium]
MVRLDSAGVNLLGGGSVAQAPVSPPGDDYASRSADAVSAQWCGIRPPRDLYALLQMAALNFDELLALTLSGPV